jgi:hypothetical protein
MATQKYTRGYVESRDITEAYNWLRYIKANNVERRCHEDNHDQLGQEVDGVPQHNTRGQGKVAVTTRYQTETVATPQRAEQADELTDHANPYRDDRPQCLPGRQTRTGIHIQMPLRMVTSDSEAHIDVLRRLCGAAAKPIQSRRYPRLQGNNCHCSRSESSCSMAAAYRPPTAV